MSTPFSNKLNANNELNINNEDPWEEVSVCLDEDEDRHRAHEEQEGERDTFGDADVEGAGDGDDVHFDMVSKMYIKDKTRTVYHSSNRVFLLWLNEFQCECVSDSAKNALQRSYDYLCV